MNNIKTDKDAFEFVCSKLIQQGERSMNDEETCMYRGYKKSTLENALKEAGHVDGDDFDYYDSLSYIFENTPSDARCAVGHLIDDKFYDPAIEGEPIYSTIMNMVINSNPEWRTSINTEEMLRTLQRIHDRENVSEWQDTLGQFKTNFDVNGTWISTGSY